VAFEQPVPMAGLLIRWTGDAAGQVELGEAFDEFDEVPAGSDQARVGEMA
jgi:hypothetical protein